METISKHELVPFTALMNMIKFNYLDKKEIFRTLLGVLGDYDPTDEENKRKTTRYIELLLSDQADLAEYLLSFLPNGMSVDHIGMAEAKEETSSKLKLKKKKTVKVYKMGKTSTENTASTTTKSSSVTLPRQHLCTDSKPRQLLENSGVTCETLGKNSPKLVYSTTAPHVCSVPDIPVSTNTAVQEEVTSAPSTFQQVESETFLKYDSYNDGNTSMLQEKAVEKCSVKISAPFTCTPSNTTRSSVQFLQPNVPLVYVTNINQAPVCPVTPSVNVQKNHHPNSTEITNFLPKQLAQRTSTISREIVTEQSIVPPQYTVIENAQHSFTPYFSGARNEGNQDIFNINTGNHPIYDQNQYNLVPENFQYLHHEPLVPNFRFPLHSTPKENYMPQSQNVKIPRTSFKHDILSIINQPMGDKYHPISEQQYQPQTRDLVNNTTRNLSAFPYTHEFVLPNGKIQNLHINRPGIQTDQNISISQTNMAIKSTNRNQPPGSILERQLYTSFADLPMQNINGIAPPAASQTSTAIFNPQHIQFLHAQQRTFQPQSQNNLRTYYTPTQNIHNRPLTNLVETPHDLLTPVQYNQELNSASQGLSNQSSDSTSSINRSKPKKLSMSANSTVRKKLRLTPNNTNLPL